MINNVLFLKKICRSWEDMLMSKQSMVRQESSEFCIKTKKEKYSTRVYWPKYNPKFSDWCPTTIPFETTNAVHDSLRVCVDGCILTNNLHVLRENGTKGLISVDHRTENHRLQKNTEQRGQLFSVTQQERTTIAFFSDKHCCVYLIFNTVNRLSANVCVYV